MRRKQKVISETKNYSRTLKIWLDDVRSMPKGFNLHVKTASEAISLLMEHKVDIISLDHDLGKEKFAWSEIFNQWRAIGSGYDVAQAIERGAFEGTIKKVKWRIHSANPVGVEKMTQALENADKYWRERKKDATDSENDEFSSFGEDVNIG